MKLNQIILTLRAIAILSMAGFVALHARGYLLSWWGISVAPIIYFSGVYVFISLVLWLATKRLFSELKVEAKAKNTQVIDSLSITRHEDPLDTTYRYPRRLGYLTFLLAIVFVALPLLSVGGKSAVPVTYLICGSMAIYLFWTVIYLFKYSVTIKSDRVVVKTFVTREFLFANITKFDILTTKNGLQANLILADGKIIRFGGMLKNFDHMSAVLKNRISRPV